MCFHLQEAGRIKHAGTAQGRCFGGTSRGPPTVVPASVKSLRALGLIGALACFDNASQSVLAPAGGAASTETRLHNYAALFSRDASASASASGWSCLWKRAVRGRERERGREEEPSQLRPVVLSCTHSPIR